MKSEVAGQPVRHEELTVRELGFGRPLETSALPCTIELTFDELIVIWEPIYSRFSAESQSEVAAGEDPDPASLHDIAYPDTITLLLRFPAVFREVFLGYLKFDFCQKWLGPNSLGPACKYVVNDIKEVLVDPIQRVVRMQADVFAMVQSAS